MDYSMTAITTGARHCFRKGEIMTRMTTLIQLGQSLCGGIGFAWLFLDPLYGLGPADQGKIPYWAFLLIGLAFGSIWFAVNGFFISGFLKGSIEITSNAIDATITIMFGDLFPEGCNAVSVNDFFDSVIDDKHVASNSLHGLMLTRCWPGNTADSGYRHLSIDIPKIVVVPKGEVTCRYDDFDLDVRNINLQPVAQDILIQHLHENQRYRLQDGSGIVKEKRPEDYLVRGLIDFDDICYDEHSRLLYKLAGQVVARLRTYLTNEDDVVNVLQYHQQTLVNLIHSQMQQHFVESAEAYEAEVTRGFRTLRRNNYSQRQTRTYAIFAPRRPKASVIASAP